MQLIISKEIINRLREEGFYPDTLVSIYFVLTAMHLGRTDLLDSLDDYSSSRRAALLYYDLVEKGFWEEAPESPFYFKETDFGKSFVEGLLKKHINKEISTKKTKESVEEWIDEWISLFPKGVKSGGKFLRSDKRGCLQKMKSFIKEYKFKKEVIFEATKSYLNEREMEDWAYTRCAVYFIHKQGGGSDLADWCNKINDGDSQENDPLFFTTNTGLI